MAVKITCFQQMYFINVHDQPIFQITNGCPRTNLNGDEGVKMLNLPITREGFVWALSISSQIHHVPLVTTMILQKYQVPFNLGSFRTVAEECGFKVRQKA